MTEVEKLNKLAATYNQYVAQLLHENFVLKVEITHLQEELRNSFKFEEDLKEGPHED